jgi:hypothetical protein
MDQLSYRFLHEEFRQLATMTRVFPTIFLGVAAFLLNVVFTRLGRHAAGTRSPSSRPLATVRWTWRCTMA